jgi:hypothetical protein
MGRHIGEIDCPVKFNGQNLQPYRLQKKSKVINFQYLTPVKGLKSLLLNGKVLPKHIPVEV